MFKYLPIAFLYLSLVTAEDKKWVWGNENRRNSDSGTVTTNSASVDQIKIKLGDYTGSKIEKYTQKGSSEQKRPSSDDPYGNYDDGFLGDNRPGFQNFNRPYYPGGNRYHPISPDGSLYPFLNQGNYYPGDNRYPQTGGYPDDNRYPGGNRYPINSADRFPIGPNQGTYPNRYPGGNRYPYPYDQRYPEGLRPNGERYPIPGQNGPGGYPNGGFDGDNIFGPLPPNRPAFGPYPQYVPEGPIGPIGPNGYPRPPGPVDPPYYTSGVSGKCSCLDKYQCGGNAILGGQCAPGKFYCCYKRPGGVTQGPGGRPFNHPANGVLIGPGGPIDPHPGRKRRIRDVSTNAYQAHAITKRNDVARNPCQTCNNDCIGEGFSQNTNNIYQFNTNPHRIINCRDVSFIAPINNDQGSLTPNGNIGYQYSNNIRNQGYVYNKPEKVQVAQEYGAPLTNNLPVNQGYVYNKQEKVQSTQEYGAPITNNLQVNQEYGSPLTNHLPTNQGYVYNKPEKIQGTQEYGAPVTNKLQVNQGYVYNKPEKEQGSHEYGAPITNNLLVNQGYGAPITNNLPVNQGYGAPITNNLPVNQGYGAPISNDLPVSQGYAYNKPEKVQSAQEYGDPNPIIDVNNQGYVYNKPENLQLHYGVPDPIKAPNAAYLPSYQKPQNIQVNNNIGGYVYAKPEKNVDNSYLYPNLIRFPNQIVDLYTLPQENYLPYNGFKNPALQTNSNYQNPTPGQNLNQAYFYTTPVSPTASNAVNNDNRPFTGSINNANFQVTNGQYTNGPNQNYPVVSSLPTPINSQQLVTNNNAIQGVYNPLENPNNNRQTFNQNIQMRPNNAKLEIGFNSNIPGINPFQNPVNTVNTLATDALNTIGISNVNGVQGTFTPLLNTVGNFIPEGGINFGIDTNGLVPPLPNNVNTNFRPVVIGTNFIPSIPPSTVNTGTNTNSGFIPGFTFINNPPQLNPNVLTTTTTATNNVGIGTNINSGFVPSTPIDGGWKPAIYQQRPILISSPSPFTHPPKAVSLNVNLNGGTNVSNSVIGQPVYANGNLGKPVAFRILRMKHGPPKYQNPPGGHLGNNIRYNGNNQNGYRTNNDAEFINTNQGGWFAGMSNIFKLFLRFIS